MIRPNVPRRNYRMPLVHAATLLARSDPTAEIFHTSSGLTIWGAPYDPGVTGVQRVCRAHYAASDLVGDGEDEVTTPWGSWSDSYSSYHGSQALILRLDGAKLSVVRAEGGCYFVLSVERLRVYRGDENDEANVVLDLADVGQTGAYDGRFNTAAGPGASAGQNPEPLPTGSCGPARDVRVRTDATDGYEWQWSDVGGSPGPWTRDECRLEDPPLLDPLSCDGCTVPEPPALGWPDPDDVGTSWGLRAQARDDDTVLYTDLGELECDCPPGQITLVPAILRWEYGDREVYQGSRGARIRPKDARCSETEVYRSGGCEPGLPDEDFAITDDGDSRISASCSVLCWAGRTYCHTVVSPGACESDGPPGDG